MIRHLGNALRHCFHIGLHGGVHAFRQTMHIPRYVVDQKKTVCRHDDEAEHGGIYDHLPSAGAGFETFRESIERQRGGFPRRSSP